MKYYAGQPVITLSEVDMIHEKKGGSARRNLNYHADRFLEGVDYYAVPLSQYREQYEANLGSKRGNPNIDVILLTETGYMLLAKTFNDDLAWSIQRALIQTYFRAKAKGPDIFEFMRQTIDLLESQQNQIDVLAMQQEQTRLALEEAKQLQIAAPAAEVALLNAAQIASQLGLLASASNNPHAGLVKAIAHQAGLNVFKRESFQDDFIVIEETVMEGVTKVNPIHAYLVRFKPAGVKAIVDWFNANRPYAYFETFYKRDCKYGQKGKLNQRGYLVGKTKYYIA